jgi:hypothetical protein
MRSALVVIAVLGALASGASCRPIPPEQQVLTNFFRASRVRDTTVLANTAAVIFEPRIDGVVHRFEITDSGAEQPSDERVISKKVTISAQVRTPDDQMLVETLVVTMRRDPGDRRWFITAIERP